jgi:hypothetical protein
VQSGVGKVMEDSTEAARSEFVRTDGLEGDRTVFGPYFNVVELCRYDRVSSVSSASASRSRELDFGPECSWLDCRAMH